jgi:hypothetical protein
MWSIQIPRLNGLEISEILVQYRFNTFFKLCF